MPIFIDRGAPLHDFVRFGCYGLAAAAHAALAHPAGRNRGHSRERLTTVIRKATRADLPRISEIRFAVRENRLSNPASIGPVVDWLFDNSTFWVWEGDGAIQGFSAADPRDGSIFALFVHPSYEGRGIGRALLAPACDTLKESGCQSARNFGSDAVLVHGASFGAE